MGRRKRGWLVNDAGALGEAGGDAGRDGADGRGRAKGGGLGVDGVGVVGTKTKSLDGAGVRHELGLPPMIGLVLLHCGFSVGVPTAVGILAEVVLADEGALNLSDTLWFNGLLAVKTFGLGGGFLSGAGVGRCGVA